MISPKRVIADLKELRSLTGDENGAQRVAFTPTWAKARQWLRSKVEETGAEIHNDAAGNFWATLRGNSDKALLIGGHIDSVPNGGWLDGCLNTIAGVEILRRINAQYEGKPPVTVRLVDWADEEGARFGKSLFGSSACSGKIDMDETRGLKDKDGIRLGRCVEGTRDRFREGERFRERTEERRRLHRIAHRTGTGAARSRSSARHGARNFRRRASRHHFSRAGRAFRQHADEPATRCVSGRGEDEPGDLSRSPKRSGHGVCTIGSCTTKPGIVTSVVEECRITLDQRHLDAKALAQMLSEAQKRE